MQNFLYYRIDKEGNPINDVVDQVQEDFSNVGDNINEGRFIHNNCLDLNHTKALAKNQAQVAQNKLKGAAQPIINQADEVLDK